MTPTRRTACAGTAVLAIVVVAVIVLMRRGVDDAPAPSQGSPGVSPEAPAIVVSAPTGALLERAASQCTIRARVVMRDGRPLRGCRVEMNCDDASEAIAVSSSDTGTVERVARIDCARVDVELAWGPEPLRLQRQRSDQDAVWDLGELVVPHWSELRIVAVADEGARTRIAVAGGGALRAQLSLGVTPNLAAMIAANEEGRVVQENVPLDGATGTSVERIVWLPFDGTVQAFVEWRPRDGGKAPITRRLLGVVEPGRFEPLYVSVRGVDFVVGHVVWSDGTPAEGIGVEALSDAASMQQLPPAKANTGLGGRFSVLVPAAAAGRLTAKVGSARFPQPYAVGIDNRVELPIEAASTLRVRVTDAAGRPVERSGVFQLNRIQRTTTGGFDREALFDDRALPSPGGVNVLAVPRIRRGERWYVVTPDFGERAYVFGADVEPGVVADVVAAGNVPPPRTVRIELPVTAVAANAMLSLKEQSSRGDVGSRCWLRCGEAFQRGFIEIENVHPGIYSIEVDAAPHLKLPPVRIE